MSGTQRMPNTYLSGLHWREQHRRLQQKLCWVTRLYLGTRGKGKVADTYVGLHTSGLGPTFYGSHSRELTGYWEYILNVPLLPVLSLEKVVTRYMLNPLWWLYKSLNSFWPHCLLPTPEVLEIQSSIFDKDRAMRTLKMEMTYQVRSRGDFNPRRRHEYIHVGKVTGEKQNVRRR